MFGKCFCSLHAQYSSFKHINTFLWDIVSLGSRCAETELDRMTYRQTTLEMFIVALNWRAGGEGEREDFV